MVRSLYGYLHEYRDMDMNVQVAFVVEHLLIYITPAYIIINMTINC